MERVLILVHTDADGTLPRAAYEAAGAGARLCGELGAAELAIGIVGAAAQAAVPSVAACGATRFLVSEGAELVHSRYASDAAAAEAVCRAAGASVIIAPMTARWARTLAGVAHRLGGRVDTHVTGIGAADGRVTATRWFYRQRMEGTLFREPRPWIILLDPGACPAWAGPVGTATAEVVDVVLGPSLTRTTIAGIEAPAAEQQTIRPDADLLFVAGAGWTKKQADGHVHADDAETLILGFLRASRASLGSSKSLVDLSGEGHTVLQFMSHMNQVGQTGSTPRHPKGLAACCHGEEPHVVGWRFITERRAVNLDPNCGWARGKADVLYVADAFAVMTRVNALLAQGQ
ncbi:MAG: electron transfer flavoprotein subunit alpha [Acidobacteria bacterium]|nr:electron transfer flavoprotein subunit alpha [Acidobacteriota bacterium]